MLRISYCIYISFLAVAEIKPLLRNTLLLAESIILPNTKIAIRNRFFSSIDWKMVQFQ